MVTKPVYQGGLMRCCLATLDSYEGPEEVGTTIGCKYHSDPNEPVMEVTSRGWEWIGYERASALARQRAEKGQAEEPR